MSKYGKRTQKEVKKEIDEYKNGRWKSRQQAIAVGLSKLRKKGYKVPPEKGK